MRPRRRRDQSSDDRLIVAWVGRRQTRTKPHRTPGATTPTHGRASGAPRRRRCCEESLLASVPDFPHRQHRPSAHYRHQAACHHGLFRDYAAFGAGAHAGGGSAAPHISRCDERSIPSATEYFSLAVPKRLPNRAPDYSTVASPCCERIVPELPNWSATENSRPAVGTSSNATGVVQNQE